MGYEYFPVEVGDQIMINPEYWTRCSNGQAFVEPYCSNGPNHIYTVVEICGKAFDGVGVRFKVDAEGICVNRCDHLVSLGQEGDIECPGDISMLFK